MEVCMRNGSHDFNLASRKAEEAAWRRFEAAKWLVSLVGPLGMSDHPSEKEFISYLRNGLVLCNAINKIKPGAVPKVVEIHQPLQSYSWDSQPLPAYQYFENVRNFLVAVEELKLPAFEASDLERDTLEAVSASKVANCILALKSYHEWKLMSGGNGFYKHMRSPMIVMPTSNRAYLQTPEPVPSGTYRRLDLSDANENQTCVGRDAKQVEDSVVKALVEHMVDSKENIDNNVLADFHNGKPDAVKLFGKILSGCLEDKVQNTFPEVKPGFEGSLKERISSPPVKKSLPLGDITSVGNSEHCRACSRKDSCRHKGLFKMQEKELVVLKDLLSRTKREFVDLQTQFERDLRYLGNQVHEMSSAALGYHRVVKENRKLYNMVQDLKGEVSENRVYFEGGNIRVYCRIRPSFSAEMKSVIDFVGEDGSLVLWDPFKPQKDGRKPFQFNQVFGPTATQEMVFNETQPLIRSVMDGYNVCIFAYGQTGSGKTHTMSGPSCGSAKDMGINYLALNDLFHMSSQRKGVVNYDIYVQMVEIYNEQVRDLLVEDASTTKLEIRSCTSDNGLALPDAIMHSVKSTMDVLSLMRLGEVNRVVSSTAMNHQSSRSHSVLTVHVHGKDVSGSTFRSCLHLVDLAGSERVDKSEVTGDRLKEAQYINKSLSCLGDVITALAQKNSHIPYRNSKLTLLLQDSLGGRAKTLMIAHISPEEESFGETISTLKFAQRVSTVELGAACANKQSSEVLQLKEQVESLKRALASREANERTPPRTRRLSIENGSGMKSERAAVRQSVQFNKTREPKSPCPVTNRTPPRTRRLSIENRSAVKIEKAANLEDGGRRPKTPSEPVRSRRLSLEGQRQVKKDNQTSAAYEAATTDLYQSKVPKSPTSSSYQKRVIKTDGRTQIPSLQLPKTPEPPMRARNEVQIMMKSELTVTTDSQTPFLTASTSGKGGSQLRKSLRTIGKLINGSEKRSRQNLMETQQSKNNPPPSYNNLDVEVKSPVSASNRPQRRKSLTGIQTSRRSSLGGVPQPPAFNDASDDRLAKTPPPASRATKRWM